MNDIGLKAKEPNEVVEKMVTNKFDFEEIKDYLVTKIGPKIPDSDYMEYYKTHCAEDFLNLNAILALRFNYTTIDGKEHRATISVPPKIIEHWKDTFQIGANISTRNLISYGLYNLKKMSPYCAFWMSDAEKIMQVVGPDAMPSGKFDILNVPDIKWKEVEGIFYEEDTVNFFNSIKTSNLYEKVFQGSLSSEMLPICAVTNKHGWGGASAIIDKKVLKSFSEMIGKEVSFYIIPSSVDELIFMPNMGKAFSSHQIEELIHAINSDKNIITKDNFLSNDLFFYDASSDKITNMTQATKDFKEKTEV